MYAGAEYLIAGSSATIGANGAAVYICFVIAGATRFLEYEIPDPTIPANFDDGE